MMLEHRKGHILEDEFEIVRWNDEEFEEEWAETPRNILRARMTRQGMSYADLVGALAAVRVQENERNLRNKIARGSFSAVFFLQCLVALGVPTLELDREIWPHHEVRKRRKPLR